MESLSSIVHQLRDSLKDQNNQWSERLKASSEELSQGKYNCKWLQAQVEHLNSQLAEAHERIKGHERDKSCLAQQVLSAEEERYTFQSGHFFGMCDECKLSRERYYVLLLLIHSISNYVSFIEKW